MKTEKYDRKKARGILTVKERAFLCNLPEDRFLNSNERHYMSSIRHKTRKALKDLNLIFRELRAHDVIPLFSDDETYSLKKPVEEVTRILYNDNYRKELLKMHKQEIRGKPDKQTISEKTRHQILEIMNSILNRL